ncbi:DNA 3'-5' helicase [Flavobacterium longum]|uniref:UvrD-helicase domain-containing protein n=1 Tax=Flavobacterium longum TaxID=1299340 RepID=UPI0039E73010
MIQDERPGRRPAFSIYDASAGSGKTYALVKEYLKIILTSAQEDTYRNILAITFTNKAVHEMKSRIVGSLSEFAKEQPSEKAQNLMRDIAAEAKLPLQEIQSKSRSIIRHIIHNYAAFDISTIDKFTHRVIRTFAHDLNLPTTFDVSLDTENLVAEAVDALIAQAGENPTLTDLLVDFTMEKTDDDKSWDISREIAETGKLILNDNNRNELQHFKGREIPEFMKIKAQLSGEVEKLELASASLAVEIWESIERNGINPASFSRGTFPNHIRSVIAREINDKRYSAPDEIAINKTAADRSLIENLIPSWLDILGQIYRNYEKLGFYRAFLKNITPLSLLNTVNAELTRIQQEQQILSIAEFNKLIYEHIQNQPAPFIYERMGEKYRHFFIDEFQDTSELQWQNLIPLIDNALSSEDLDGRRGSLMIVGDPKQSIYRWRGGKAEQFIALSKTHNPFNNPEKELFTLGRNHRSYSQVVDFNNDFFRFLSGEFEHEDYRDLYENRSRQQVNDKTGGYVELQFIPKDVDEEEPIDKEDLYVNAVFETISRCRDQGFSYGEIAVLTRKRDHGVAVANFLTAHGIPIISSETLIIANATEVRFIVNLLRYLRNGNDIESKALFLQYIGRHLQDTMPLHDFLAAGVAKVNEKEFEDWLSAFGETNAPLSFQDIRKKSLYEAVEFVVSRFVVSPGNAYVQYFLDIVLERDMKAQGGISEFLEYWDRNAEKFSIPSPEHADAVRIMTIHKSKGLEFPVVIFPFAEENFALKPKDKLWLDSDESVLGLPKVLVDNTSAVEAFGSEASAVFKQKKQEELLDNINVLYVALTRAEEQLFVISAMNLTGKERMPAKNNLSSFFIRYLMEKNLFNETELRYVFGKSTRLSVKTTAEKSTLPLPVLTAFLPPNAIRIAQRESLMWGTKQQEAIEYGNVVHEILSSIATAADVAAAVTRAVESGLITAAQRQDIDETIGRIISHESLREFYAGQYKVLSEKTIIRKDQSPVKPDRIVLVAEREVYLLDYKTGAHHPKYIAQLESYQHALESMGYRVSKKVLVYIGATVNVVDL